MIKKNWSSRGYVPHYDNVDAIQHLTYTLKDASSPKIFERINYKLQVLKENYKNKGLREENMQEYMNIEKLKLIHEHLDLGYGECYLKDLRASKIVEKALFYFDNIKYNLFAWCIMPNHVHVLLQCREPLSKISFSLKSYTAKKIKEELSLTNKHIWQREYYDRFMRDAYHFKMCKDYIEMNPVKAGLVKTKEDWQFSSASSLDGIS